MPFDRDLKNPEVLAAHQAGIRRETAQAYQDQYLARLLGGDTRFEVVDKMNAAIQELHLAGDEEAAQALAAQCADAAVQNASAQAVFLGALPKVLEAKERDAGDQLTVAIADREERRAALDVEIAELNAELDAKAVLDAGGAVVTP